MFGGYLESYAVEHNRSVPVLVTKCIEAIESMGGLQKEGIYRVSGRQSSVEQLKHEFELDEDQVILDSKYDVFTIATVLKTYFREMKRPLFDFNIQSRLAYSSKLSKLFSYCNDDINAYSNFIKKPFLRSNDLVY